MIGGRALLRENDSRPGVNSLDRARHTVAIGNLRWQFTPGPRLALTNQAYIVEGRYRNTVPDGRTRQEGLDRDVTWRGTAQFVVGSAAAASDSGTSDRQTLVEVGGQAQILSAARVRRRFTTTTTTVLQDDRGHAHHAGGLAQRSMGARSDRRADAGRAGRALHARPIRGGITVVTRGVAGVTADDDPRGRGNAAPGAVVRSVGAPGSTRRRRRRTDPLRPEDAITVDLGAERRIREAWRLSMTGYYRRDNHGFRSEINDFRIAGNRLVGPSAAVWANTVSGHARGMELTLDRRAANGVSGWISHAYGHTRMKDSRTGESYVADYDQTHMVNAYAGYRSSSRLGLSARFRYGSNFPLQGYFDEVDGGYASADKNRKRLPAYARLDLRAERSFTY